MYQLKTIARVAVGAAIALATIPLQAQSSTVFATGLVNPSKVILGPAGTLLVSEVGTTPSSGRISVITSAGVRRTLIDGLPSGVGTNGADGPNGIVLDGNTLYVAIGEGDELAAGAAAGTQVPNPKGPSSLILNTVLQINFSQAVDGITSGFTLKADDQITLADGDAVTLTNGDAGGKATVSILASFRNRPDATVIYKNSHPYGLIKIPGDATHLYMTNAGLNSVVTIDTQTGHARTAVKIPAQKNNGTTGAPVIDAVPDSIRVYGDKLLVTLLTGFPFFAGNSKVLSVDPATGQITTFIDNLNSSIDIVWRARPLARPVFYVLEYSANFLAGGPGRVKVFNTTEPTILVDDLKAPTSMALDAAAGKLYITSRADGTVLLVDIGN